MFQRQITERDVREVLRIIDFGLCSQASTDNPTVGKMTVQQAVCLVFKEPHWARPSCVAALLHQFTDRLNDARWSSNASRARGLRRLAVAPLGTADRLDQMLLAKELSRTMIVNLIPRVFRILAELFEAPYSTELLDAAKKCEREGTLNMASEAQTASLLACAAAQAGKTIDSRLSKWAEQAARSAQAAAKWAAGAEQVVVEMAGEAAYVEWASKSAAEGVKSAAIAIHAATYAIEWHALQDPLPVHMKSMRAHAKAEVAADQLLYEFAEEVVQFLVKLQSPGSKFLHLTEQYS